MSKRYDISTPRKGKDDKTFWTRIGTAWENEKGIQLVFDALPLPDAEGRCVANLFEPRERGSGAAAGGNATQSYNRGPREMSDGAADYESMSGGMDDDLDDDIPF